MILKARVQKDEGTGYRYPLHVLLPELDLQFCSGFI
jgi:hypothetical protein